MSLTNSLPSIDFESPEGFDIPIQFVPPKMDLRPVDITVLIQQALVKSHLNHSLIFRYLSITDNLIANDKIEDLILIKSREYVNRIPAKKSIIFLQSYYLTIKGDITRFIIFLCMLFAIRSRYNEMFLSSNLFETQMLLKEYNFFLGELEKDN